MPAPLDNLEQALNLARVRLNDAIQAQGGEILTDTQPFTLTYVNGAWRRFQELLVNFGVTWLKVEIVLLGFPPVAGGTDPSTFQEISWSTALALPQNFISPLVLWERPTGINAQFFPMDRLDNGLPAVQKTTFNKSWEWRNGIIFIPGATQSVDIRIRYAAFYPDFVPLATTAFNQQLIPIMRSLNPFAWFICSEVAKARGDIDAEMFDKQAQQSTRMMFDLDETQGRSLGNEAELGKMPDAYSATMSPVGQRGPGKGEL